MKGRITLLSLTVTFMLHAFVASASAQTRIVGVGVGDTFMYSWDVSWSSNDPNATIPSFLLSANETEWSEGNVTAISGTNITGQVTTHYRNDTEETFGGWINVETGSGENMTFLVISANLSAGDSLYTSSYANWFINETVPKAYLDSVRDTNHVNITSISQNSSYTTNYYWDKSIGVLVDALYESMSQVGVYTTIWSESFHIVSSNVWIVPEFPSWTPPLLMAAIALTAIVTKRKCSHSVCGIKLYPKSMITGWVCK